MLFFVPRSTEPAIAESRNNEESLYTLIFGFVTTTPSERTSSLASNRHELTRNFKETVQALRLA